MLSNELIDEAARFLEGRIRRTPMEHSPELSGLLGVPVWLKLENLQITGSFKIRGAWFHANSIAEQARTTGVVTCSAGNHGKALAYAARELGVAAKVFVPRTVDESKYRDIAALGAEVVRTEFPGYGDSERYAQDYARAEGVPFVHPYEQPEVMAGNGGTLAAEILADLPEAETFLLPVGGGGMMAGFAYKARLERPQARLVGCQHRDSPALQLSLERGEAVNSLPFAETLAGGLEGGLGTNAFSIIRDRVAEVILTDEDEIWEGVRWMLDHHQLLIEPSSAPVIAACLKGRFKPSHGPVAVVLSGRNLSLAALRRILRNDD